MKRYGYLVLGLLLGCQDSGPAPKKDPPKKEKKVDVEHGQVRARYQQMMEAQRFVIFGEQGLHGHPIKDGSIVYLFSPVCRKYLDLGSENVMQAR